MVEIRTFDGDFRQLAAFCNSAWSRRYQGRMPFPVWSPDFLEWELDDCPRTRELIVAAYDGGKLVGVMPARPMKFHLRGQIIDGSWGSYLSVDPSYENQPVSVKMHLEQRHRHKRLELKVNVGYVITGYAAGRGHQFWLKQQRMVKPVRRLGTWVRTLDPMAVARFSIKRLDVLGMHLSRVLLRAPRPPKRPEAIRSFVPADAEACAALLDAASRRADFGYVWDEPMARRQLGFEQATRTLVAEQNGRVEGLINYCALPLMGRAPIVAGLIDFLETENLPIATAVDLVRAALTDMRSRGIHLAMALRASSIPFWPMARTAFTMVPAEYCYVAQPIGYESVDWRMRRLHVHWR